MLPRGKREVTWGDVREVEERGKEKWGGNQVWGVAPELKFWGAGIGYEDVRGGRERMKKDGCLIQ